MDPLLEKLLIAAVPTIITASVLIFVQSRIETIKKEREKLHEMRRKVYNDILEPFVRVLASANNNDDDTDDKAKKKEQFNTAGQQIQSVEYRFATTDLNLVADDAVILAYNDLMQYFYKSTGAKDNEMAFMDKWSNLLLEIRRSLGNTETQLRTRDMLASWIKDIDAYYPDKTKLVGKYSFKVRRWFSGVVKHFKKDRDK